MRQWLLAVSLGLLLIAAQSAQAQRIHRQNFEAETTSLRLGLHDGEVRLLEHGMTADTSHSGNRSERVVVRTTAGTFCFLEYPVPKCLVFEELAISAWVNASLPGTKLLARVVLPNLIDEATGKPTVTILRGDAYDVSGRWRRLEVRRPDLILDQQKRLLQAEKKDKVDFRGAYVDALLFDIHSGLGDVAVHVDDIQVGPIVPVPKPADVDSEETVPLPLRGEDGRMPHAQIPDVRDAKDKNRARVDGDRLWLGDRAHFIRGIRQRRAPLPILAEAGFNTVFSDWPADETDVTAQLGMQPVPMLGQSSLQNVAAPSAPKGLAVYLGDDLDLSQLPKVRTTVDAIRAIDTQRRRPMTGAVTEAFASYSSELNMIGTSRNPLASATTFADYRVWLRERRNLARPGTFFWTWIPTELPESYCRLVYGHGYDSAFQSPVGPQPDQIRLMTYAALAAGYRGIAFTSDASLAESSQGRARLLQLALLNLELTLIEPFLAEGKPPVLAKTSNPKVMAVVFEHSHGVLVMPIWSDAASQFVVGQAAVNDLQLTLGEAAEAAQAYQISLSEVRALQRQADIAGFRVTVPEFDSVAFIVMTTDTTLISRYQELIQQVAPDAAAWYTELAEIELAKTEEINARLESMGQPYPQAVRLLVQARENLERCRGYSRQGRNRLAIAEAVRSLRIGRALQHQRWKTAVDEADSGMANPFALTYYTLPEFYQFETGIAQAQFGENQTPSGDFESEGNLDAIGWRYRTHSSQKLPMSAYLVGGDPQEGQRSLQLRVTAEEPPLVVENTTVEMISPPVSVRSGQIAKISGYVRLPRKIHGSVDGAVVWDSLGGRALGMKFTNACDWKPFVFYRPVSESGELRVHLALTGVGDAFFDDVKVEIADNAPVPLAGQTAPVLR